MIYVCLFLPQKKVNREHSKGLWKNTSLLDKVTKKNSSSNVKLIRRSFSSFDRYLPLVGNFSNFPVGFFANFPNLRSL